MGLVVLESWSVSCLQTCCCGCDTPPQCLNISGQCCRRVCCVLPLHVHTAARQCSAAMHICSYMLQCCMLHNRLGPHCMVLPKVHLSRPAYFKVLLLEEVLSRVHNETEQAPVGATTCGACVYSFPLGVLCCMKVADASLRASATTHSATLSKYRKFTPQLQLR